MPITSRFHHARRTLALAILLFAAAPLAAAERPNVLVILSDDQGWGDLSVHGNTNLSTPNIDSLARDGALFDRFFVCPVCSPTRAEFLTGRYHVRGNIYSTSAGGERLDLDERTIAQAFEAAGYATGAFGKWHNGSQYPYHPNARGFDEYYGFPSGHWGDYFDPPLEHNGQIVRGEGFIIDDLTDHAMAFIETNRDKPFFCYVPFNTPHTPMQAPDSFYDKFADKDLAMRASSDAPEREDVRATRAVLAMCENLDWNVGRLLAKLDELKLADDTIVLYFCDNGPNTTRWNGGMRGRKGSTDEGGVRSPLLMRWPGHIPAGTKVMPIAGAIDLLPTLTELAGVDRVGDKPLDGRSLAPVLLGEELAWDDRMIFSHWSGKVSVRTQRYRLDSDGHLYDMAADPGQSRDVAGEHPQVAADLREAVAAWRGETLSELSRNAAKRVAGKQARGKKKGPPQAGETAAGAAPFAVGYAAMPTAYLPARDGVEHGGVKRSNTAPNCSFFTNWTTTEDSITWDIDVATAGRYEAVVYYTCPEADTGSTIELRVGDVHATGHITEAFDPPLHGQENDRYPRKTESFVKDFKPLSLGTLDLPKGVARLTLRALEVPGKSVADVRMVALRLLP